MRWGVLVCLLISCLLWPLAARAAGATGQAPTSFAPAALATGDADPAEHHHEGDVPDRDAPETEEPGGEEDDKDPDGDGVLPAPPAKLGLAISNALRDQAVEPCPGDHGDDLLRPPRRA